MMRIIQADSNLYWAAQQNNLNNILFNDHRSVETLLYNFSLPISRPTQSSLSWGLGWAWQWGCHSLHSKAGALKIKFNQDLIEAHSEINFPGWGWVGWTVIWERVVRGSVDSSTSPSRWRDLYRSKVSCFCVRLVALWSRRRGPDLQLPSSILVRSNFSMSQLFTHYTFTSSSHIHA